jgi:hypothetical protein
LDFLEHWGAREEGLRACEVLGSFLHMALDPELPEAGVGGGTRGQREDRYIMHSENQAGKETHGNEVSKVCKDPQGLICHTFWHFGF